MLLYFCLFVSVTSTLFTPIISSDTPNEHPQSKADYWTYKKYSEKYDLENVAKKIQNASSNGNLTGKHFIQTIFDTIDPTEDLLSLNVEPGDTTALVNVSQESMFPDKGYGSQFDMVNGSRRFQLHRNKRITLFGNIDHFKYPHDWTAMKPRIIELMKQAIYDSRTKMIGMQIMRERFKYEFLWRMGFLISKADNRCRVYGQFAWLAYRMCIVSKQGAFDQRMPIADLIATQERLVTIRFEIELITDLIQENDEQARMVLIDFSENKKYKMRGRFAN